MEKQNHEYQVEPISISPAELQDEKYKIREMLNEYANDGWKLIDSVRVDSSSLLFILRRSTD